MKASFLKHERYWLKRVFMKRIASFLAVTLFLTNLASTGYAQDTPPVYTINTDSLSVKTASEAEPREVKLALNDFNDLSSHKIPQYMPKNDELKLADYRDFSTGYQIPGPHPYNQPGRSGGGGGSVTAGEMVLGFVLGISFFIALAAVAGAPAP